MIFYCNQSVALYEWGQVGSPPKISEYSLARANFIEYQVPTFEDGDEEILSTAIKKVQPNTWPLGRPFIDSS